MDENLMVTIKNKSTQQLVSMIDSDRGIPVSALIKLLEVLLSNYPTASIRAYTEYDNGYVVVERPKTSEEILSSKKNLRDKEISKLERGKQLIQQQLDDLDYRLGSL